MQCGEDDNRFLVRDEDMAKSACLIAEGGLSLMAQLDIDSWPLYQPALIRTDGPIYGGRWS